MKRLTKGTSIFLKPRAASDNMEKINASARKSLDTYEVIDDTCRMCYVDGYEEGYSQAIIDLLEGKNLDGLITKIQVHVVAWNFGGVDKTPYHDMTEYVKVKLKEQIK